MLPEHKHTVSATDGPLKPHDEIITNGGDNIITITASALSECSSTTADEDIIKSLTAAHHSNKTSGKIVQFLKSQRVTTTQQDTPCQHTNIDAEATVSETHQPLDFCNVSQCVSFQDNIADVHHRKGRRLNGLQLPLHPLQIFGWLVLVLFGVASFFVLIPSFAVEVQGPLYGLISGLYIVHVASHVAALLIDPADRELRRVHRNDRIVPEFDRSKHTHVIENGRCHLCNIRTSSQRTKHCSVCNKCVGKFDHHCKWLNHCVGSRNYVAFLMCVVSAVIATLVIVAAVIAQIVLYCLQPEWLSYWQATNGTPSAMQGDASTTETIAFVISGNNSNVNDTFALIENATTGFDLNINATNTIIYPTYEDVYAANTTQSTLIKNVTTLIVDSVGNQSQIHNLSTKEFGVNVTAAGSMISSNSTTVTIAGISISDTIFLILIGFLGLLAAITAGLLLHLCFFHIYISFLGLTTYEYIRNHRQAHEAKAKNMLSTLPNNGQSQTYATNPSKKTNNCGQIYFCSSMRHPNSIDPTDLHYFETHKATTRVGEDKRSKLHCCANSREYHQTGLKAYYMCSLLEESPRSPALGIAHISGGAMNRAEPLNELNNFKTFHCCSTFAATATQRKVSAANTKATLVSDLEAALSARRSYMQYTEQCTFCTFRIRSPMMAKRSSAVSIHSEGRPSATAPPSEPASKSAAATSKLTTTEHQRCCMKTISKNQRWRRKWNCCSNVPDSPDVPNDIIAALAMRHQHGSASSAGKKTNATEIPVHFIKSVNGNGGSATGLTSRPSSPRNATVKAQARSRNTRTWPGVRLRHMMRMLNRYRRPRCRHNSAASAAEQIKQNQIRPMQLQRNANGCQHHYHNHNYYDSSSPQPPSSTTTASERSSDLSQYSDSSALTTPSSVSQPGTIETILPTSVIRADTSVTYTMPVGITLPPALPPPTRRRIPNPTDLEELAENLGFISHPSTGALTLSPAQRLPVLNNVYRRQRRKHFLRTRSPTLSPIHESGLSNPTSPQPCRHNAGSCSPNITAAAVVNNLCGSTELLRKASSNSSLHSVSSNSSST